MKKILKSVILILIVGIVIYMINGIYQENKIKKSEENAQTNLQITSLIAETEETNKIYSNNTTSEESKNSNTAKTIDEKNNKKLVPEKYKGKDVIAKLKIEKLKIDTCVLKDYNKANLDLCVTKFYGAEPNEIGNLCIAGHNYITKNMFGYLKWLKIGDKLTITDNKHGEVEYKIYDSYRVEENDTHRNDSKNKWKKRSYTNYLLQLF